jgi:hypothetical protein
MKEVSDWMDGKPNVLRLVLEQSPERQFTSAAPFSRCSFNQPAGRIGFILWISGMTDEK